MVAAAGLAAATVAVGGSAVASSRQAADCAEPYLPLFGYATAPSQANPPRIQVYPENPVTFPSLDGEDLTLANPGGPDTDGDGHVDELRTAPGGAFTVKRGDGTVSVTLPGVALGYTEGYTRAVFDLDGDGRDEVQFASRPASGAPRSFVLPGTTSVGSHLATDVAIEVPSPIAFTAGDQVDGPGDDVLVPTGSSGVLTSGDAIMAAGPGGSLATYEPASAPFDQGMAVGLLQLDDGPPTIVLFDLRATFILWDEGETTSYRIAGAGLESTLPLVSATRTADRTLLVVGTSSRSGGLTFVWDVGDPCSVLPSGGAGPTTPAPAPAPAPGAQAVEGDADYTG